ncbi:MAG: efflux RND transporter periplasmic adaptor subunit [Phycisphaerales bacterium]
MTRADRNRASDDRPVEARRRAVVAPLRRGLGRGMALAILASIGAVACSRGGDSKPTDNAIRPVKTLTIAAANASTTRSFPGRVEATRRVELAFQVPGLLLDVPVTEGQRVKKGDVVARLREDEFRARLNSLQGQLDQSRAVLAALRSGERPEERLRREAAVRAAEARLANARADFNRFAELVNGNAVSRAEYERAEAAFKVAEEEYQSTLQLLEKGTQAREEDILAQEASVRSLEGRVDEARIQLADCALAAPFDGVVAEVFVQRNQTMRVGQPVIRFQNTDEIDVAVDVPEAVMANDIRSPDVTSMEATFSSAPGRSFPVRVREVSQFADPTTQTFLVRFAMPAPDGVAILPGMSASVTIGRRNAGEGSSTRVPLAAVVQRPGGEPIVWIVDKDGGVRSRTVTLGSVTGSDVLVSGGLAVGDRVAIAGASSLREGMKVRDLGDALGGRR